MNLKDVRYATLDVQSIFIIFKMAVIVMVTN